MKGSKGMESPKKGRWRVRVTAMVRCSVTGAADSVLPALTGFPTSISCQRYSKMVAQTVS